MTRDGWEPSELARRCQIHSAKMDEEGHYVTSNILHLAANELSRLERLLANRDADLTKAARIAREGCLVPPDGGSPTQAEAEMCDLISDAILRLI